MQHYQQIINNLTRMENYAELAMKVIQATKEPILKAVVLTYNTKTGYWFNGVCYGQNVDAATNARRKYYEEK